MDEDSFRISNISLVLFDIYIDITPRISKEMSIMAEYYMYITDYIKRMKTKFYILCNLYIHFSWLKNLNRFYAPQSISLHALKQSLCTPVFGILFVSYIFYTGHMCKKDNYWTKVLYFLHSAACGVVLQGFFCVRLNV